MSIKSLALFGLLGVCSASFATEAVTFTSVSSPEASNVSLGWTFTVTTDLYVTGLGYLDIDKDGFASRHDVGIFDLSSSSLVASASLGAGTSETLLGDFRYAKSGGEHLSPGVVYMIVGTNPGADGWSTNLHSVSTIAPEITPDSSHGGNGSYYEYGQTSLTILDSTYVYSQYYGPSFTYETSAVPEPASLTALTMASLALVRRKRKA